MCPHRQQPASADRVQPTERGRGLRGLAAAILSLVVLFCAFPQIAVAQDGVDDIEDALQQGTAAAPALARFVAPPMVDDAAAATRWSIFRASLNGPDEERTFETFRTVSQELGYTLLPFHASALHREARQAMAAGDRQTAARRLDQAATLAPGTSLVLWGESEQAFARQPWAIQEWVPATVSALRSEWRTPTGRYAMTTWAIALINRVSVLFLLSGLLLIVAKYSARLAFDLRLMAGRAPTWRQIHVAVLVGLGGLALVAPLWVTASVVGASCCAYAGKRDVPLLVATALASLVAISPLESPGYDVTLAEWIAAAPASQCPDRCVDALERASADGMEAATVALAWTHYRRGNTAELTRAAELLDSVQAVGEAAAWQALLRGHLAMVAGDLPAAEAQYRDAAEHTRDRETRATITISLSRHAVATSDTETARQLVLAAAQAGHPLLDQWTRYEGRSQNALLPGWQMSAAGVLEQFSAKGVPTGARWNGLEEPHAVSVAASFVLGLLLALGLHKRRIRNEACRSCGTPTSRFVLAAAHKDGHCVWCFQASDRNLRISFDEQHAREFRAESRSTRMKVLDWLTVWFAPGGSLWLRFAPLAGGALWLASSIALGIALTDDRVLLTMGEGSPIWSVIRPVWPGAALLGLNVMIALLVTRSAHQAGGAS